MDPETALDRTATKRSRIAWCLYDWANSAFPTIIVTFVFATYFTGAVAESKIIGTVQWGYAVSLSALAIALLSPVCGAISDHAGPRKPWIAVFTLIAVLSAGLIWFVEPDPAFVVIALVLFALGNMAFEMGMVFYNAMLPGLGSKHELGKISGWGWGLGYFGGLSCLILAYFAFINPAEPLFGLDKGAQEHVRITGPMVALWFGVFALPLFFFVPDRPSTGLSATVAMACGLRTLWATIRRVRQYGNIARFLLARLIYIDGLNTLFAFGAIYAAGSFGMELSEIFLFAIALNITAGIGAILFGYSDDRIGSRRTILIALAGMVVLATPLLIVDSKTLFWVFAVPLGLFMGPAQAASRTLMARLTPPDMEAEMFGLFAFSGKATAFLGPAVLAWVTSVTQSQRLGMATIIVFLLGGMALLLTVREDD